MSKPHVCTPESCPEPGKYFVTATADSGQHFWCMAGPYSSHAAALADALNRWVRDNPKES